MKTVVFLHIPKTAGQTIHHQLAGAVGKAAVSPVRVHTEVPKGQTNLPPGYLLHSGHLDWTDIATLPEDRFVFTVLRDPLERIASFYFYLLKEAGTLSPEALATPEQTGKRLILDRSADDYFFGGDARWQAFLRDHYDNFYCSYLVTRRMRGRRRIDDVAPDEIVRRAVKQAAALDGVYHIDDLGALEDDIGRELGKRIRVAGHYSNTGPLEAHAPRWPRLLDRFERDDSAARLERFADLDRRLMERLGLPGQTG